jgi:hypothetical protein
MFDFGVINLQFEMCETKCQIKESCHCFFFGFYHWLIIIETDCKMT